MNFKISGITKKVGVVLSVLFLLNCSETGAMWTPAMWTFATAKQRATVPKVELQCDDEDLSRDVTLAFCFAGILEKPIRIEVRADNFRTGGDLWPGEVLSITCPRTKNTRCRAFSIAYNGGDGIVIGESLIDPSLRREKTIIVCVQYADNAIGFKICDSKI